jgi:hypothetical protein
MSFTRRQNMQDYALAITRAYLYSQNIVTVPYKRRAWPPRKERELLLLKTIETTSVFTYFHVKGLRPEVKPSPSKRRAATCSTLACRDPRFPTLVPIVLGQAQTHNRSKEKGLRSEPRGNLHVGKAQAQHP